MQALFDILTTDEISKLLYVMCICMGRASRPSDYIKVHT